MSGGKVGEFDRDWRVATVTPCRHVRYLVCDDWFIVVIRRWRLSVTRTLVPVEFLYAIPTTPPSWLTWR